MSKEPKHISLLVFAFSCLFSAGTLYAQESSPSFLEGEQSIGYKPEEIWSDTTIRVENRATENPSKLPGETNDKPTVKAEEEESVLGFNFLYYFIQRFKKTDILGE